MDFAADLPALYAALGTPSMHTSATTGISTAVNVMFSAEGGAGGIDGVMQGDGPQVRLAAAAVGKPRTGDGFVIGAVEWEAASSGVPINEGAEYIVSVRRVAA